MISLAFFKTTPQFGHSVCKYVFIRRTLAVVKTYLKSSILHHQPALGKQTSMTNALEPHLLHSSWGMKHSWQMKTQNSFCWGVNGSIGCIGMWFTTSSNRFTWLAGKISNTEPATQLWITQYTHHSSMHCTPILTTRKKGNKSSWFREMIIISRKIKVASLNDVKLVLLYFCICVFVYMTFILSQCRMPEAITNQSLVHCHLVVDRPGNHRLYTLYICIYSTGVTLSSCIFMFNARMLL